MAFAALIPERKERPPAQQFDVGTYKGHDDLSSLDDLLKGRNEVWWRRIWVVIISNPNSWVSDEVCLSHSRNYIKRVPKKIRLFATALMETMSSMWRQLTLLGGKHMARLRWTLHFFCFDMISEYFRFTNQQTNWLVSGTCSLFWGLSYCRFWPGGSKEAHSNNATGWSGLSTLWEDLPQLLSGLLQGLFIQVDLVEAY